MLCSGTGESYMHSVEVQFAKEAFALSSSY